MPNQEAKQQRQIGKVRRKIWPGIRTPQPFVSGATVTTRTLLEYHFIGQDDEPLAVDALDDLVAAHKLNHVFGYEYALFTRDEEKRWRDLDALLP